MLWRQLWGFYTEDNPEFLPLTHFTNDDPLVRLWCTLQGDTREDLLMFWSVLILRLSNGQFSIQEWSWGSLCWYGKYCIMEIEHDKWPPFIHDDFLSHKLVMSCESNKLLVNSQLLKDDTIHLSCRTKRKVWVFQEFNFQTERSYGTVLYH